MKADYERIRIQTFCGNYLAGPDSKAPPVFRGGQVAK
jgi:hypothetical protein